MPPKVHPVRVQVTDGYSQQFSADLWDRDYPSWGLSRTADQFLVSWSQCGAAPVAEGPQWIAPDEVLLPDADDQTKLVKVLSTADVTTTPAGVNYQMNVRFEWKPGSFAFYVVPDLEVAAR